MSKFPERPPFLSCILGIGLLFLVVMLAACSPAALPEKRPAVSTLRVVMDNNYPPYVFQDEQGHLKGILIDQWKLWEERSGVKVEITALPWGDALERMKAGEFDVIDTAFYTPDRSQYLDYTDPYAQIDIRIFFHKNISGIANVEDLKGFKVAVKTGDASADNLRNQGGIDLIYYDSYEEIIQAAKRKEVTIFVIDEPPALYLLYKYGIYDQFNYSASLGGNKFYRAVHKGDASTLALVKDGFLRISKAEYQEIDSRWLGSSLTNDLQKFKPYLIIAAALASLIILVLFTFNRMLQSRVQTRTLELQEALNSLQKSETRFREAIEFFPVPVSIANSQGKILSVNRKFVAEYGYSLEDIPGVAEWMSRAYPNLEYRMKVQSQWDEDVAEAVNSGASTPLREYKVICKDGSQRNVELVMHPVGDLWVASFNNVTERKQVEAALQESETIFSSFLEHSPIYVFFKDTNIRALRLSNNFEKMLGIPVSEALGKTMNELFPSELAKSMVADDLRILSEGRQVDVVEEFNDRIYETTKFPVLKDGKPEMLAGFTIDITDRKRAEEALRRSEMRFKTLIENSADALTLLNADGTVFYEGPTVKRLTGYSVADRLGKNGLDNIYPADLPIITDTIARVLAASGNSASAQFRSIRSDGSVWWTEGTATNLLHDPSVQAIVVNYRDITERKQAEENLRESEERFRQIVEASPMGMHMYQLQADRLVFTGANPAADQILGVDNSQFIGKAIEDAFPPLAATEVPERYRRAASEGIPWETVQVDYDYNGIRGAYETHAFQTGPGRMAVMFLDITERKKAQADLENSEKRNRAIVAALPDLLFELSADGCFLDCIASDPSRLLVPREQAIGRRVDELLTPELAALTMEKIQQTLSEGAMQVFDYSLQMDSVMKYYEGRMTPLGADSVLVLVREITESKQIEQALRQSEQRYRTLFEQANDAIFVETLTDQILDVNQHACQMLGYTREELLAMRVSDLIAPQIHRDKQVINKELFEHGRKPFESLDVRKDGVHIPVEVTNSILPGGLALSIVRDITERKQAEDALRKSEAEVRNLNIDLEHRVAERTAQLETINKELEAFSYSVSHDLRAPLRAIDGFSRIVLEDHASQLNSDVQKLLERISVESQHMAQIIDALLNLSRMSRAEMRKETVDLSSFAHQVLDSLRQSQPQRQVECVIASDITVQGDARLLNIVLENLLGNAWKFTSRLAQARIEVGVIQSENGPIYFVRDNGAGFDPAYAEKLFGVFQRLHRSDEFEGTGVGLATVQRIISRHGGRVWAEAEVDKGATIYFTLG